MVIKAERRKIKQNELKIILNLFKNKLREQGVPFKKVLLFGSYASGLAHQDSDIDVAVIMPSVIKPASRQKLKDICWLAKQINVKLEPHLLSESDFKNRWFSLPAQIKKDAVAF